MVDPAHNYLQYWYGRDYEHAAEEMAIKRLLEGKMFREALDVGGGYGRLRVLLEQYADSVTLAEPSKLQLEIDTGLEQLSPCRTWNAAWPATRRPTAASASSTSTADWTPKTSNRSSVTVGTTSAPPSRRPKPCRASSGSLGRLPPHRTADESGPAGQGQQTSAPRSPRPSSEQPAKPSSSAPSGMSRN